ncbi:hypothetical protein, partial [Pseudomarimonas arenosa]|uniref:hypothetical protein n=1 Tax=Pseudomarimonas arenosa TaxID=2774145 RepID=UPI001CDBDB44
MKPDRSLPNIEIKRMSSCSAGTWSIVFRMLSLVVAMGPACSAGAAEDGGYKIPQAIFEGEPLYLSFPYSCASSGLYDAAPRRVSILPGRIEIELNEPPRGCAVGVRPPISGVRRQVLVGTAQSGTYDVRVIDVMSCPQILGPDEMIDNHRGARHGTQERNACREARRPGIGAIE